MVKTIKKSLAIVLCLAVCLSLFCIPASATYAEALPYMLCTYEDGARNFSEGTIVEGGVGGSGHAMQMTVAKQAFYTIRVKAVESNGTIPTNNVGTTVPAGSSFKVSFWAKAVELKDGATNLDFHLRKGETQALYASDIERNVTIGQWYKFEIIYTPTADETFGYLRFQPQFGGTILMDDFEITLIDADAPASSNFAATGGIVTGNQVTFAHTFTPATSSAAGVTDTSLVRLVNVTEAGEKGIIAVCGINETMTIPALPADSAGVGFEVVPMSSDGKAGQASTYTPPEPIVYANELPYILCTYEDGAKNLSDGVIVEGGLGGSGHAMQLATTSGAEPSLRIKQVENASGAINPTNFSATVPVGSKLVISFWGKAVTEGINLDFHIYEGGYGNWVAKNKSAAADGWYKWTFTVEPTAADGARVYNYIRFRTNFTGTCLIDDFEITFIENTADAPASSNFTVTGDVVAGNRVAFAHTFTPASSSASGVTDASLVRLINVSSAGERAVIGICGINEVMTIPATPANSASMEFEVVPMSSDSKAGAIVAYAIPSTEVIEGITLERVSGNEVKVSTDTELVFAMLIYVTYDVNGKMVDNDIVAVSLAAQAEETFSPFDLTAGDYTKVMLWYDTTDCMPLADMIRY